MISFVFTCGNVVVRHRVMKFTIIDQVDTARLVANLVSIIPAGLSREQIGECVFKGHLFCGKLRAAAEEARIQIEDCLATLLVTNDFKSFQIL
jgi:hypothetical protein